MSNARDDYYKHPRFAGSRFQPKREVAIDQGPVENFSARKVEVLSQCLECNEVQLRRCSASGVTVIRCQYCDGHLELLTVDGAPQS